MIVGDGRLGAAEDAEREAPVSLLVLALVVLSALVVGRWWVPVLLGGFTSGRLLATCVALATVVPSVASARVSTIASASIALATAPRGVHLVLAELLELPAIADVVGVPSME